MSEFAGSTIDHMGIGVSDILQARAFYERALEPLGITLMMSIEADPPQSTPRRLGFGSAGKPFIWLHDAPVPSHGVHIALIAQSHEAVDAFHAAAMVAGGKDNGAPGIRPHYHSDYYAAYVLGPDGVNLEAVCQLTS
ncbi:VOC family protein [Stutzerimonas stutzeri]|uniref:VOC family protein n=1 Tax=Stutzerimonas stutzeri TaxID=316 RepID=UPI0004B2BADD|nr:VOC family protein [Stutzerimonas stutzeri]MCQ4328004.1 VOC family protein [Stutzerimonas stutzeri]